MHDKLTGMKVNELLEVSQDREAGVNLWSRELTYNRPTREREREMHYSAKRGPAIACRRYICMSSSVPVVFDTETPDQFDTNAISVSVIECSLSLMQRTF